MADLITRVRTLVGDEAGANQALTDQQIQDAMDTHRWEARYMPLTGIVSYESGVPVYKTWQAPWGQWESDAQLTDTQYGGCTPTVSDFLAGRWTFAQSQTVVYLTGWTYDLYAAAADLLEAWAGKVSTEFDFTADGASFHRSQKAEALRTLAEKYRRKQQIRVVAQVRGDLNHVE